MPTILVQKRLYGFDEQKIFNLYNKIKSFEKTDYIRQINEFLGYPYPILNIEVASCSISNERTFYANYEIRESRGTEYDRIILNNRRKDLVKKELKKI
jgi:hypothetical protein